MENFSLKGYGGEHITLNLIEVLGYPETKSYDGGYDLMCSLEINCSCYSVKCDRYYSASGALYRFQKELKECCKCQYNNVQKVENKNVHLSHSVVALTFKKTSLFLESV